MWPIRRIPRWAVLLPLLAGIVIAGGIVAQRYAVEQRAKLATTLTGGDANRAPWLFTRYGCAGCHTIDGIPGADGRVGPPLRELVERVYIGGSAPNSAENLVAWLLNPQRF